MTGIELKQLIDKCATELERLEIIAAANLGERSEAAKRALAKRKERITNKNNKAMKTKTYNVVFNDETSSNDKGFEMSYDYCLNYIRENNGTNHSYFADYKKGTVSIVCNETGETVFETEVI